ncbi:hypothetical protein B0H13DRAFT_2264335, partial [Mycena leptocephala]
MSISVAGIHTASVATSDTFPVTVLSSEFVRTRLPSHPSRRFGFTINRGPHGSFTIELACSVSSTLATDVCMGLDWKAGVREWLISLGLRPSNYLDYLNAIDPCDMHHPGLSFATSHTVTSAAGESVCAHDTRSMCVHGQSAYAHESQFQSAYAHDSRSAYAHDFQSVYAHNSQSAYAHNSQSAYTHNSQSSRAPDASDTCTTTQNTHITTDAAMPLTTMPLLLNTMKSCCSL